MDRRQFIFSAACATAGVVSGATDEKKAVTGGGVVYSRSLPVECEVDVFVAGGGPAGVAAAVAAARGGAKVFLARLSTFASTANFFRGETPRDGAVCRESSRIAFRNAV